MEKNELGKRINAVRKDRGLTADWLSEMCNINATYLRQIEGGVKMPSLPVHRHLQGSENLAGLSSAGRTG